MSIKLAEFNLPKGKIVGKRYIVQEKLGAGWEGEVYRVAEVFTGIQRAIKLFYPSRNPNFEVSIRYAKKFHKLHDCPIVMEAHSHEIVNYAGHKIACLVCEYIDGQMLSDFVNEHRGKSLEVFKAIHLLYALVKGVESIHQNGEYHGDLHADNIIVKRFGLSFDIKIIDLHHWGDSKKDNRDEDIIKMIRIFYDILGGQKKYKTLPWAIKDIICGLKRGLILQKFKTVSHLRSHLEIMDW